MPTPHPSSIQHFQQHLAQLLSHISWLCPCLPTVFVPPPSPPTSPQEDELQTLLSSGNDDLGWDDNRDGLDLRMANPRRSDRYLGPSSQVSCAPNADARPTSVFTLGHESSPEGLSRLDPDATSLRPSTIDALAARYEPTLTLEDIEREEREQTERERQDSQDVGLSPEEDYGDYVRPVDSEDDEAEVSFGLGTEESEGEAG